MVVFEGASHTPCARILNSHFSPLDTRVKHFIERETLRLHSQHVVLCRLYGLKPVPISRFCFQIAEQFARGVYELPRKMTAINDDGCWRLLTEIVIKAEQQRKLRNWHSQYVSECESAGVVAYSLQLIIAAVDQRDEPLSLQNESLTDQAARINAVVEDYTAKSGRKPNARWYARQRVKRKPSKVHGKYDE